MKKIYKKCAFLFAIMLLVIAGAADAVLTGTEKSSDQWNRQPGIQANISSAQRIQGEAVPEGLTKNAWGKIRAAIEQDRYQVQLDEQTGSYQAPNFSHGLQTVFTPEGFQVSLKTKEKRLQS